MSSSVPRRMRPGNGFNFDSSTTLSNPPSSPPTPDGPTFRDLLIFEERLKQNAARLQRRKHKYQGILLLLCSAILLLSSHVLLSPKPQHPLVHYAQLLSLIVCGTTVFLFFASGMYAERIVAANRFVPQANRALRPFNMYLNTRRPPAKNGWLASLPFIGATGAHEGMQVPSPSTTSSRATHFPASPSTTVGPSIRLVRDPPDPANPSALPPLRRMQIQPMPPSSNPRGEIIFSSKVSPTFREGYERYRNAFERRRREKLDAAEMENRMRWRWRRWLFSLTGGADGRQSAGEKGVEEGVGAGGGGGSGVGTPTGARRGGIVEKISGTGTAPTSRSKGGATSGTASHKRGSSRQHSHRSRTDSLASIASTASNSTQSSSHGHVGGDASGGSTQGQSSAPPPSKRKSSPRRKLRELPPTSSSSIRRASLSHEAEENSKISPPKSGKNPQEKTSDAQQTSPDPTKVANEADWRGDAKATLREPASPPLEEAKYEGTDLIFQPVRESHPTLTEEDEPRMAKPAHCFSSPSSSSSEEEDEENDADRSLVDLGSASILTTASLHESQPLFPWMREAGEGSREEETSGDQREEACSPPPTYPPRNISTRAVSPGGEEGSQRDSGGSRAWEEVRLASEAKAVEGWVEVRRTNSSRRRGGGAGTGTVTGTGGSASPPNTRGL